MLFGPDGKELAELETRESLADITREFLSGGRVGAQPTSPSTAYRKTAMVFASVRAIGNTIAQLPFRVEYKEKAPGKLDPIARLFSKPGNGLSRFILWYGTLACLELAGNAVWRIGFSGKYPTSITPLNPRRITPNTTRDGSQLLSYTHETGYNRETISTDEVVHFRYWNDSSPWWGLSTLQAAMLSVQTDQKARLYNSSFFDNSATLGGLLIAEDMQQNKANDLRDHINEKHQTPSRAHRTLVLGGNYKYYQIGIGQKDMDFLGLLNDARDTINAVFNVPGILTNNPNNRNYATAWAELRVFHLTNWGPKVVYIEDELENQFFDRYAPEYSGYFDKDGAPGVGDDIDALVERAKKLWAMGTPYNEIIELLDLPLKKHPWGEVWYMPTNLTPIGLAISSTTEDDEEDDDPAGSEDDDQEEPVDEEDEDSEDDDSGNGGDRSMASRKMGELARESYWSAFSSIMAGISDEFAEEIRRHFGRLRAETLRKIADYSPGAGSYESQATALSFNLTDATVAFMPIVSESVHKSMETGGNQMLADLGLNMDFGVEGGEARRLFLEQQEDIWRVNDTVHSHLVSALKKVLESGGDAVTLQSAAKSVFSKASNRARMIAKVETHRAINAGRAVAAINEAVDSVEWLASRGGISRRHEHQAIDGSVVSLGEEFPVGLRWPGDVGASGSSPDNLIECNCTFVPVVD